VPVSPCLVAFSTCQMARHRSGPIGTIADVIKTAQLRVYQPMGPSTEVVIEPALSVKVPPRQGRFGIEGESMQDDGLVTEWRGKQYVCPRTPTLRMLEGVLAVRRAYGQMGGGAIVPEEVARDARRELDALQDAHPEYRSHILTSAWHVPMRWFVPFHPSAKELVRIDGYLTIRYRTALPAALERLDRAVEILSRSEIPDTMVTEIDELVSWLEPFGPTTMVELDYGDVGLLFSAADLALDDSVAVVWNALEALADDEWELAGDHYGQLVYRWTAAMAVSYSS
jgi:hypothetical protein